MVINEVNLKKSDNVLLIGFGGIGFIYAALLSKIKNIYVLENNKTKFKLFKKLKLLNTLQIIKIY